MSAGTDRSTAHALPCVLLLLDLVLDNEHILSLVLQAMDGPSLRTLASCSSFLLQRTLQLLPAQRVTLKLPVRHLPGNMPPCLVPLEQLPGWQAARLTVEQLAKPLVRLELHPGALSPHHDGLKQIKNLNPYKTLITPFTLKTLSPSA